MQRAAGAGQSPETYGPSFGVPHAGYPYGDEPADQAQINAGIAYYEMGCGDF